VPHHADGQLAAIYKARGWNPIDDEQAAELLLEFKTQAHANLSDDERAAVDQVILDEAPLQGVALTEALRGAGLSTSGTADEKRTRLVGDDDDPE
jgi:hypothetical protein